MLKLSDITEISCLFSSFSSGLVTVTTLGDICTVKWLYICGSNTQTHTFHAALCKRYIFKSLFSFVDMGDQNVQNIST